MEKALAGPGMHRHGQCREGQKRNEVRRSGELRDIRHRWGAGLCALGKKGWGKGETELEMRVEAPSRGSCNASPGNVAFTVRAVGSPRACQVWAEEDHPAAL